MNHRWYWRPVLYIKVLLIGVGIARVCGASSVEPGLGLVFLLTTALLVRVAFGFARPVSRLIPGAGSLLALAILSVSIFTRIEHLPEAPEAPSDWTSRVGGKKPDYSTTLLAEALVSRELAPGRYLVRTRITGAERRLRKVHKKQTMRGARSPRSFYKKRRYYGKWSERRARYRNQSATSFRKRTVKKKFARAYKRDRYYARRDYRPPESVFPVALNINDRTLHRGCTLRLRIFGRAVPRALERSGYDAWLRRMGATSTLRVSRRYHVLESKCPPPELRDRARRWIGTTLRERGRLRGEELNAALGVILGNSRLLGHDFKAQALSLGILHLFAASGLHLAILYGCLYVPLAFFFGRRRPWVLFAPLPLCFAYPWLLEFPVSLSRAFVFMSFVAVRSVIDRRMDAADTLADAALVMLLWMPREFATLSGALSFGAVAGILFLYEPLREFFRARSGPVGALASQLSLSLAAGVGTLPTQLFFFRAYSFASPLVNVCLVPLMGVVLPLMFGALFLEAAGLSPLAEPVWFCVRPGMELFSALTRGLSPYGLYMSVGMLSPPMLGAIILCLLPGPVRRARVLIWFAILLLGPVGAMLVDAGAFFTAGFEF